MRQGADATSLSNQVADAFDFDCGVGGGDDGDGDARPTQGASVSAPRSRPCLGGPGRGVGGGRTQAKSNHGFRPAMSAYEPQRSCGASQGSGGIHEQRVPVATPIFVQYLTNLPHVIHRKRRHTSNV